MTQAARALFQSAYENRYTWDASFPGYTADVQLRQGDRVSIGKVRIDGNLSYEILELSDEKVRDLLQQHLWETATHRKRNTFEQAHGKHSFDLGETDETGAVEILVGGDAMGSHYKVRNSEISQVSRTMPQVGFTINHNKTLDTGAGYISIQYDVVYRKPESNETVQESEVESTYENIDGYYILTRQVTHLDELGQQTTTETSFSNIKLLQPVAV